MDNLIESMRKAVADDDDANRRWAAANRMTVHEASLDRYASNTSGSNIDDACGAAYDAGMLAAYREVLSALDKDAT